MFGPLYLCEKCDESVSGIDLLPITNYGAREFKRDRYPVGQCPCGGLCYDATDDEKLDHMIRESEGSVTQHALEHRFPKVEGKLSLNDSLTVRLLTERYEGVDDVFCAFDEPDAVVLRVPPVIRRKTYRTMSARQVEQ